MLCSLVCTYSVWSIFQFNFRYVYLTSLRFCSCIERRTRTSIRRTHPSYPNIAGGLNRGKNKDICRYPGSVVAQVRVFERERRTGNLVLRQRRPSCRKAFYIQIPEGVHLWYTKLFSVDGGLRQSGRTRHVRWHRSCRWLCEDEYEQNPKLTYLLTKEYRHGT